MRVRMPEVPSKLAPKTTNQVEIPTPVVDQPILSVPPTNTSRELQTPTTSAPREPLQQILPKTCN